MKINVFTDLVKNFQVIMTSRSWVLNAWTYLQLPLRQPLWGADNFYLLVLSSWKVNIAESPHCRNGVVDMFGQWHLHLDEAVWSSLQHLKFLAVEQKIVTYRMHLGTSAQTSFWVCVIVINPVALINSLFWFDIF